MSERVYLYNDRWKRFLVKLLQKIEFLSSQTFELIENPSLSDVIFNIINFLLNIIGGTQRNWKYRESNYQAIKENAWWFCLWIRNEKLWS